MHPLRPRTMMIWWQNSQTSAGLFDGMFLARLPLLDPVQ